ncbi:MAG: alkaline phosphatase family protein [Solirubrobacteraceae bacterium]
MRSNASLLRRGGRLRRVLTVGAIGAACLSGALVATVAASASPSRHHGRGHGQHGQHGQSGHGRHHQAGNDGLGVQPGKIKHVWLIILENKSYDATFTGLNNNTYLWQTLPSQGVLLNNYYGTGHFSLDNYISLVSGQATQPDTQSDCPDYDLFGGSVDTSGSLLTNPNYGQVASANGPNTAAGYNGCVYPASVPTLFNQLDAAHVSWKGYAQDLGNPDASGVTHSQGPTYCGAPYTAPGPAASSTQAPTQPNPGSANATDQYVPKHFPFPWFESLLDNPNDCNPAHIANLFDPSNGLYHDLQSEATTPAFSWISPNNCSDGHDAVCYGNNLSGGFSDSSPIAAATQPNPPVNYTGGLYSADLFLEHVIPEIEASPAFRDGGLIDITFDEGFPPFTYTGNSFANSTIVPADAETSVEDDSAAETLFGRGVHWEPTGPNTPLETNPSTGQELFPGPGDNAYVDRPGGASYTATPGGPSACVTQTFPAQPAGTCLLGGGDYSPGARTDTVTDTIGINVINDNAIVATDVGRQVTAGIPASAFPGGVAENVFVGQVTDTPTTATAAHGTGFVDIGSFTLVDGSGNPVDLSQAITSVTLAPETAATDPLYNADSPTTGGGDTGSVLISPYIKPGSVSNRYYNHYSWLRTMEDLFNVASSSPGLDGEGHIGYAAQPGLAPFGRDVFTNAQGHPRNRWGYRLDG